MILLHRHADTFGWIIQHNRMVNIFLENTMPGVTSPIIITAALNLDSQTLKIKTNSSEVNIYFSTVGTHLNVKN